MKKIVIKSAKVLEGDGLQEVFDRYKKGNACGTSQSGEVFLQQQRASGGIIGTAKYAKKELQELCEQLKIKFNDAYVDRVKTYVASDETVDSYGDIIMQNGWDLKRFKINPAVMWVHDYTQLNIGSGIKSKVENSQLMIDVMFALQEDYPFADTVFKMVDSGFTKGNSVGFIPKKVLYIEDDEERMALGLGKYGVVFEKQELLEDTVCPIGSNPAALVQDSFVKAIEKGIIKKEDLERIINDADAKRQAPDGIKKVIDDALALVNNKTFLIPDDKKLVKCYNCKSEIDYDKEDEIAMGAIKCPKCEKVINQEGEVVPPESNKPEQKAGAVLNKTNKGKLKQASDLVLAVLSSAEDSDGDKGVDLFRLIIDAIGLSTKTVDAISKSLEAIELQLIEIENRTVYVEDFVKQQEENGGAFGNSLKTQPKEVVDILFDKTKSIHDTLYPKK